MMNYNLIAPYYDVLSRICFINRQQMAHRLILNYLKPNDRICWIGGGSGWFLAELNQLGIPLSIDYIEFSEVMMQQAQKQNIKHLNVNFIQLDMFKFHPKGAYDVVISAFIFDHFTTHKCDELFHKLNKHLKEKGIWFYVDFTPNQTYWQRFLSQLMVHFFDLIAGMGKQSFPKIEYLFNDFNLLQKKTFFLNYIESIVYQK